MRAAWILLLLALVPVLNYVLASPDCTTTGGYAREGSKCVFPFKVVNPATGKAETYSRCIPFEDDGMPKPYLSKSDKKKSQAVQNSAGSWCVTKKTKYDAVGANKKNWGYCNCKTSRVPRPDIDEQCRDRKSNVPCAFSPTCESVSFIEATAICKQFGARLCTVPELVDLNLGDGQCPSRTNTWTLDQCTEVPESNDPHYVALPGRTATCSSTSVLAGVRCCVHPSIPSRKRNVLMIVVDDLRPELSTAYGRGTGITPELDKLTRDSRTVTFGKAYANYPQCGPSRLAMFTGITPEKNGLVNIDGWLKQRNPKHLLLPEFFSRKGFHTLVGGKVFDERFLTYPEALWDEVYEPFQQQYKYGNACQNRRAQVVQKKLKGSLCKIPNAGRDQLVDFELEYKASAALAKRALEPTTPFFMVVGFYKPHLPWVLHPKYLTAAPKKKSLNFLEPTAGPQPRSTYFRYFYNVDASLSRRNPKKDTPWNVPKPGSSFVSTARRAYAAAVMQTDSRIGILLERLNQYQLADSTLVIVVGDNGFLLGENGLWNKDTIFELALRVPLIMHIPWANPVNPTPGVIKRAQSHFIELTDLYPTIAGLMEIGSSVPSTVMGRDFSKYVLSQIEGRNPTARASDESYSMVRRCVSSSGSIASCVTLDGDTAMDVSVQWLGLSIRNSDWRYSVWLNATSEPLNWNDILSQELYDHRKDDSSIFNYERGARFETEVLNVAEQHPKIAQQLLGRLQARFAEAK